MPTGKHCTGDSQIFSVNVKGMRERLREPVRNGEKDNSLSVHGETLEMQSLELPKCMKQNPGGW